MGTGKEVGVAIKGMGSLCLGNCVLTVVRDT